VLLLFITDEIWSDMLIACRLAATLPSVDEWRTKSWHRA